MNLKEDFIKAAVCGATGGLASYLFLGESAGTVPLPFVKIQVPSSVAIGSACAGASLISDLSHDYVLPHINKSQKLSSVESSLLQIGTSGAATAGLLIYGSGAPMSNLPTMFMLWSWICNWRYICI